MLGEAILLLALVGVVLNLFFVITALRIRRQVLELLATLSPVRKLPPW
jgi:hypothetical protein